MLPRPVTRKGRGSGAAQIALFSPLSPAPGRLPKGTQSNPKAQKVPKGWRKDEEKPNSSPLSTLSSAPAASACPDLFAVSHS